MGAVLATIAAAGEHDIWHRHRVAANTLIIHLIFLYFNEPFDSDLGQHLGCFDLVLDRADPLDPRCWRGNGFTMVVVFVGCEMWLL